jgi:Concanavalin A-like lectin/glucanases superfamily
MLQSQPHCPRRRTRQLTALALTLTAALGLAVLAPAPAEAQPFGAWLTHNGTGTGRIDIPHHSSFNITAAFTFEAWVSVTTGGGNSCRSIAGKGFTTTWWIGVCGTTLRSYLKGSGSLRDAGVVPANRWTHIAVVFNGSRRLHYINGELVGDFPETGPLPTNGQPVRIASDVNWEFPPTGAIDEVRLWNVARTTAQIRAAINVPISAPQAGLVAVWALNGNAQDVVGSRDGVVSGTGIGALTFPVAAACAGSATSLCLHDRFAVTGRFRTGAPGTAEGIAQVASCPNDGSGLFWFFTADNWEVMVKAINGCGLTDTWWVFSAATTNVFYRLEVFDVVRGANKIYFNYPGPPAPAVVDTGAFATCP